MTNTPLSAEDIINATAASNRKALGSQIDKWVPFLTALGAELKALDEAGKLPDAKAHADLWREISLALQQYANTL